MRLPDNATVVWVDGGEKIGTVVWTCGQVIHVLETDFINTGDFLDGYVSQMKPGPVYIGWERSPSPSVNEVTGLIKWLAHVHHWYLLTPAAPSERLIAKVEWIDQLNWCPRKCRDDGMDACRHLLAWMIRSHCTPSRIADMIAIDVKGESDGDHRDVGGSQGG